MKIKLFYFLALFILITTSLFSTHNNNDGRNSVTLNKAFADLVCCPELGSICKSEQGIIFDRIIIDRSHCGSSNSITQQFE